jgi:hypothetical protein
LALISALAAMFPQIAIPQLSRSLSIRSAANRPPVSLPVGAQKFWGVPNLILRLIRGCDIGLRTKILKSGKWNGTEAPELVEIIFRRTVACDPDSGWPEMSGVSSVLDFGGGCGIHYKLAKSSTVRWAVVETARMVERASELATDRLRFFTSIDTAKEWLDDIDVMHSRHALHYTTDPADTLQKLCSLRASGSAQ